jgi:hypothetical protein
MICIFYDFNCLIGNLFKKYQYNNHTITENDYLKN